MEPPVTPKEITESAEPGLSATRIWLVKLFGIVFAVLFTAYALAVLKCAVEGRPLNLPKDFVFVIQLVPVTVMAHAFGTAMGKAFTWLIKAIWK